MNEMGKTTMHVSPVTRGQVLAALSGWFGEPVKGYVIIGVAEDDTCDCGHEDCEVTAVRVLHNSGDLAVLADVMDAAAAMIAETWGEEMTAP